jgi:diguanylate cyclase (GGDEF)-like protein
VGSRYIDSGYISSIKRLVSDLVGIDFSVYDHMGNLIVRAEKDDPVIKRLSASPAGSREYREFLKNSIEKSSLRRGISIFRGPMNQYHPFVPVHVGDLSIVIQGHSYYEDIKDLQDFCEKRGYDYGLSKEEIKSLLKVASIDRTERIIHLYEGISKLFELTLSNNFERNLYVDRHRKAKIVIDFLSEIEREADEERIYSLLVDAIIFLFGGETISLMRLEGDKYIPFISTGPLKEAIQSVTIDSHIRSISEMIDNHKPLLLSETIDILRLGYPEEINSVYYFPLYSKEETIAIVAIFNTVLKESEVDIISRLCSLAGFIIKNKKIEQIYKKRIDELTAMNLATANLGLSFKDPDVVYDTIVEISSILTNAERVSLMLPDPERAELFIKAVKGINKWIAQNIRVRVGEGIAGKVYKDGRPLIAMDIEKDLSSRKKTNYRTGSFASVPLKIGDEVIGVLNLADKISGEVFSETDLIFLRHFASFASIVIKGAQYYNIAEEMKTLSITDSLTGLFNRRYFDNRLFEEIQRAIRYESVFSLAILDIDDFKLFNDSEGHLAGDEILKAVADISRDSVRSIDILSRIGGEEFAIIMPQTDTEEAFLVAERVRKNIRELIPKTWKKFPKKNITVSIGIASYPKDGKDPKNIIKAADKSLYRAKIQGKDRTISSDNPDSGVEVYHNLRSDKDYKR